MIFGIQATVASMPSLSPLRASLRPFVPADLEGEIAAHAARGGVDLAFEVGGDERAEARAQRRQGGHRRHGSLDPEDHRYGVFFRYGARGSSWSASSVQPSWRRTRICRQCGAPAAARGRAPSVRAPTIDLGTAGATSTSERGWSGGHGSFAPAATHPAEPASAGEGARSQVAEAMRASSSESGSARAYAPPEHRGSGDEQRARGADLASRRGRGAQEWAVNRRPRAWYYFQQLLGALAADASEPGHRAP